MREFAILKSGECVGMLELGSMDCFSAEDESV